MTQRIAPLLAIILSTCAHAIEWLPADSNTTEIVTGMVFPSPNTGYACGSFGTLLKSTDAGRHWHPLKSPSNASFTAIEAFDSEHVFCGRQQLFRSSDGGATWEEVDSFREGGASIFAIEFVSSSTGYLVKSGYIYRTQDGGLTWESVFAEDNEYFLDRLYTPEPNVIIATGGFTRSEFFGFTSLGFVLRSDDSGDSWELQDTTGVPEIMAAAWPSADLGIVFTQAGTAFRTVDGGKHWNELASNLSDLGNPLITSAQFTDAHIGYAVSFDGKMLHTVDGGATWMLESEASSKDGGIPLVALALLDPETVLGAGNEGLIFRRSGPKKPDLPHIEGVDFHRGDNLLELTVMGVPGVGFRLESSENLQEPWTVESVQVPDQFPWTARIPIKDSKTRFYRLAEE